jgi:type II secretion system protein D
MEMYQAMEFTGAALERERVFLSVDIPTNSLIVSASEENFEEITTIAKQLDTKPAQIFGQIRIVDLGPRLAADDLKEKIDELWKRKGELRAQAEIPEDLPVVVADERSNALVVASSLEDYEEIVRLVESLQTRPFIGDTRLFALKQADATVLAGMLDDLFEGIAGQSETFEAPTIIPDSRSNSLIVAAAADAMERVEVLIQRLDVEAGPTTSVFKVYPLSNASAGNLAPRIDELFQARQEGVEGGQKTPVVVLPDEASNSLVVSASRDDHAILMGLLELLDRPSTLAKNVRIFPLSLAKAANVAEKLDALFQSQAEGGGGRADAIATEADERTNSIIVWASPSQMANVAEVVERLDTATPTKERMVRVIQLKQALAEDFATLLQDTLSGEGGEGAEEATILSFVEETPEGERKVRKLLQQDITVQADPRTNSLMVMAPPDSMEMLETMIRDFDKIKPITSEIRLFPLINADAQAMVDKLTEIFEAEAVGGGAEGGEMRQQLTFGDMEVGEATVGQELRFAADTRTNTLIAAGAPSYLRMVEDFVHFLDAQEVEDRVTEVYPAKFRDATDLAEAVKNFVQQETEVLGDLDDEESRMRRMERQISVEAIGDPEEGSSTLLIGTDRRAYQRTMEIIQGLDRPEPQVMISVLIAEVTLSDDVELGVEIAGQDLTFSENATVGPNGIIQGTDFDVVGGTSLGAGGPLGFSFTVTGEDFNFLFHAFQRDSRLEVLSRPVLLVRNGEEGNITIADQVPIITSQQVSDTGSTNVTPGREDVGVVLTATPHISPDGYVTIELEQEVSNIGEEIQLTDTVTQPIFSTREVTTNVTVRDGETIAIGGLIQSSQNTGETKVPILGDIPGLGWLFRTTTAGSSKTELLLVLTVDILRTDEDVRRMSVEQRDKFMLPPSILKSPLMEGLRIRPEEEGLGPRPDLHRLPNVEPRLAPDGQLGPRPNLYGPKIQPAATPTSAAAAATAVYGPKIVRNTPPEEEAILKSIQP